MKDNTITYSKEQLNQAEIDQIRVLQEMLRAEGLELHSDREWRELAEHIHVHKYLINQEIKWSVSWDEAVFSWFDTVYKPLKRAIRSWEIRNAFPEKTEGQLYLAVATHWHFLKERLGDVTPEEAARDFAAQYGTGIARWFSRFLQPTL